MAKVTLFNIGERGFVLKEGFLAPKQGLVVEKSTAERMVKMYPAELKAVGEEPAEEKTVEAVAFEEEIKEVTKKRSRKSKAK